MISIPLIYESEFILEIWLNTPPTHAGTLVSLAVISINISSFTYFLYQAVHATGKIKSQQITISLLYFLNIVAIYISYKLGTNFYFAYYITIIVSIAQCVANIYFAKKYIDLSVATFLRTNVIRCIFATILIICIPIIFVNTMDVGWTRVICLSIVEVILSLIIGYIIVLDKSERLKIKKILMGFIKR